jgi:TorA maturation chaperone TorD
VDTPSTSAATWSNVQDLAELAPARRDFYRFISAAFLKAPGPELLGQLRDESFQAALGDWFSAGVVEKFRRAAEAMDAKDFAQAARLEFTNLFLVPGGQHIAPYESVFRDSREIEGREISGLLLGPSAAAVQQWYRLAALEISADFKELPDHIGLELHYLAYLCAKEQEFADGGDHGKQTRAREMQRDFLKAHVLSWLPDFAAQIQTKAKLPLYPAIASLAVEFCQNDLASLEAVVGPSCGQPVPTYTSSPAPA